MCRRSAAVGMPVKYECESNNLTCILQDQNCAYGAINQRNFSWNLDTQFFAIYMTRMWNAHCQRNIEFSQLQELLTAVVLYLIFMQNGLSYITKNNSKYLVSLLGVTNYIIPVVRSTIRPPLYRPQLLYLCTIHVIFWMAFNKYYQHIFLKSYSVIGHCICWEQTVINAKLYVW